MIWIIAKKEILENLLSYRFSLVMLLTVLLIFVSFLVMYRDYTSRLASYSLLATSNEGPVCIKRPNQLSILAKGFDEEMSRPYNVGPGGIRVGSVRSPFKHIFSPFSSPDVLFIVKVLLSLVAVLFAFNSISGEKEAGTLALMLSNPISKPSVFVGKWLGGIMSLLTPLMLAITLGLALINLSPIIVLSLMDLKRIAIFLVISIIYVSFFLRWVCFSQLFFIARQQAPFSASSSGPSSSLSSPDLERL